MSPEVITAFPEKRWARCTTTDVGVHLQYGVGLLCSSYTWFTDPVEATFAQVAWIEEGLEPRRTGTLQGLAPVVVEQLEACR